MAEYEVKSAYENCDFCKQQLTIVRYSKERFLHTPDLTITMSIFSVDRIIDFLSAGDHFAAGSLVGLVHDWNLTWVNTFGNAITKPYL